MTRAVDPEQGEVCIRWAVGPDGVRQEDYATSYVVLWHDQFGTRHAAAQHTVSDDNPDSDLMDALSFEAARQLLEAADGDTS
jgi:hypothetical protein